MPQLGAVEGAEGSAHAGSRSDRPRRSCLPAGIPSHPGYEVDQRPRVVLTRPCNGGAIDVKSPPSIDAPRAITDMGLPMQENRTSLVGDGYAADPPAPASRVTCSAPTSARDQGTYLRRLADVEDERPYATSSAAASRIHTPCRRPRGSMVSIRRDMDRNRDLPSAGSAALEAFRAERSR